MFRSGFQANENQDPHQIHRKILLAAKRTGVISLNGRGLSYGIILLNKFGNLAKFYQINFFALIV